MNELAKCLIFVGLLRGFAVGTPLQRERNESELEVHLKEVTSRLDDLTRKFDAHMALTGRELPGTDLTDELTQSEKLSRFYRATDNDNIAFTAAIMHKSLEHLPAGTTVLFDHLTRSTPTFDLQTGVFTCPQSGLYLFSIFVESGNQHEAFVHILMDGKSYTSATTDGPTDTGGNLVLLDVKEGSRLWVETFQFNDQSLWLGRTSFSGVLIHRDVTK